MLATVAAVGAALAVVPSASAQGTDTTAPVLNVGTLTPTAPLQRNGNPPAAPSSSTGNGNWFTHAGPTVLNLTATDDVAVTQLQYSTNNGASWTDIPITPGPSVSGSASFTAEGNNSVRYRALDAAGNAASGVAANTTLNQAAAEGATAIRLQSTNGRAAGDALVIDTGDNAETVRIASLITPAPAAPAPNVNLAAPLAKAHAAATAVQAFPPYRTINVQIDTRPPTGAWPASVVNNRIGHGAAAITPTRTDPTPGSGGTAVRDAWLDGTWVYPLPLDVSKLSLGKHTWTLGLTDTAGNGNKVTFTFLVTTSFADVDALLARFGTAGTIPAADVTALRAALASAKSAADGGDPATAVARLDAFVDQVRSTVGNTAARNLLATDAQDVTRQVRGIPDAAAPSDLGVTSERYPGQPRHPYVTPAMPVHNANARFKVLVIANKSDGSFRHPAIEDAEVMLQQMGAEKGFDVDLWDPSWPTQSLPDTPFTSAANLAQYAVIIGDSSVGNNTFNAAYTMKDGTVVNERAAFKGYINNGGGYVALHAANDSMHTWQEPIGGPLWYQNLLGGLFKAHPGNQNGFGTDCGSCYWVKVVTEDPSHPSTDASGKPREVAVADELYSFDRKPRPYVHPLMTLDESTYYGAIGVGTSAGNTEGADHPIAWCSNYDGGREWSQVLGHNWELFMATPWFRESIYQGILTAAGFKPANCVTHGEVKTLLASLSGLTPAAVTAGTAAVDAAFTKYMTLTATGYSASLSDIDALRAVASDPASGDAASRAQVLAKAQELKDWMLVLLGATSTSGTAAGNVPATLSLTLGAPATFGAFTPGIAQTYTAGTTANVVSTAGDAKLSVSDASATATGRLVNGSFSLTSPLQAKASSALGAGGAFAAVGGSSAPTSLLTYSGPASNDAVSVSFSQDIGANEALRTGSYSKTLTFTLSTTTP
ncbi:MAG TPA: ThuA domain-containing protein [Solirubrobacter sp.]|nr:ThuA domain-containing protein [Solirubrobacter sp.]